MADRSAIQSFVQWCKNEQQKLRAELTPLEDGTMHVGRRPPGGQWQDITSQEIETLKRSIANLEAVIKQHDRES